MALPEDLRSALLRSYSRDEFANYHRALQCCPGLAACRSLAEGQQSTTAESLTILTGAKIISEVWMQLRSMCMHHLPGSIRADVEKQARPTISNRGGLGRSLLIVPPDRPAGAHRDRR